MTTRGALHIGRQQDSLYAQNLLADFAASGVAIDAIEFAEIKRQIPNIRDDWTLGLSEAESCDIDVAALLAAYLRQARRRRAILRYNAEVKSAAFEGGVWSLETRQGNFTAALIVNAAGAWADQVAEMADIGPVRVQPYRRTVVQLATERSIASDYPLVIGLDGSFYFKIGPGGRLWLSPHDETLTLPCDAAPEEYDVALAIERLGQVVDCGKLTVEHKWAGLRSFAPDRLPVIGRDPAVPEFFWLAGQGGFGIQTAPAVSKLAASLICPEIHAPQGILPSIYAPSRLK
jgi:D-arginine dehydrogenase